MTTHSAKEEVKSILQIVVIAMCIRIFLIEPFFIPSPSMETSLMTGDYIFSTKYTYGFSRYSFPFGLRIFDGRVFGSKPQYGDIVVFHASHDPKIFRYIKRLVGLPGDKIKMHNNILYINGVEVKREFIGRKEYNGKAYNQYTETLPSGLTYNVQYLADGNEGQLNAEKYMVKEWIVPEGHYFLMGDNRDQSADSRYRMGTIPFENLISKAQFIFFSTEQLLWLDKGSWTDQLLQFGRWVSSIRFGRMFKSVYSYDK